MKLQQMKNGFLGIDQGTNFQVPYPKAKAIIIPFGMESHVSYGGGAKNGPRAILKAAHELNENDEQTFHAIYRCGLATVTEPKIPKDSAKALDLLAKITKQVLADKKFPMILGGEHSLTPGALRAVCEHFSDISILHFDAHADLRYKYRGSVHSHASALRRAMEDFPIKRLVQVGIRTVSEVDDELSFMKREKKRIKTFWGWHTPSPQEVVKEIATKNVYISFDVDAFDSSLMPSTGTPEPGGLLWWSTLEILKEVFKKKNVVAADLVELAPIDKLHGPDFLAARLVYKMIGYKFFDTKTRAI
jgi:agmatinase